MLKIPVLLVPTAPSLVRRPFHRDGWIFEEKVDGWRMLAYREGSRVRLVSRNGVDHTTRFPELAAALTKLRADPFAPDGEVAVFDANLVSGFHLLGDERPAELCTPPLYMAFDVLQAGKRDTRALPLERRRVILEDVAGDVVDLAHPVRRLDGDGAQAGLPRGSDAKSPMQRSPPGVSERQCGGVSRRDSALPFQVTDLGVVGPPA